MTVQSTDANTRLPHLRRYRPSLVPGLSAAIILFVAVFWLFLAFRLQEVDLNRPPDWWLAQVQAFPLLAFVPPAFVTFITQLFSWRVLRHILIPTVLGWWLAGEAATGFVHSFYNFASRAEAANFLGRLQSHAPARSGTSGAVAPARGRTRLRPAIKVAFLTLPFALTFILLLFFSAIMPPTPARTTIYNTSIVIMGALWFVAIAYVVLDTVTGGAPSSPGLRLQRETLDAMRREHALLRVGGPGRIVVPNSDVVVTEYNARCYRVLGPGVQTLLPFEYVRTMLDLRLQEREGDVSGITQDGVEVTCHIAVTFRLSSDDRHFPDEDNGIQASPEQAQRPTRERPYPFGERAARTAAYIETVDTEGRASSWTSLPMVVATGRFRRALALFPLDALYDPEGERTPPHPELSDLVQAETRENLRASGIELIALRMGPLHPPQQVMDLNLSGWQSYWEKHLHRRRIEGRVEAAYTVEDARTRAAVDMLRTIMESIEHARRESNAEMAQEIIALQLLEALERAALAAQQAAEEEDPQVQRQLQALRRGLLPPGPS